MDLPFGIYAAGFQAEPDYAYATDAQLRFDQRRLARLVGAVAFGLPIVLGIGGVALGEFRPSLSDYYHEGFLLGAVFVGSLCFIGALLFAYRGWCRRVGDLATVMGLAALMVALFPVQGWDGRGDGWSPVSKLLHYASALVLFALLAFFCFFVFTRLEPHQVVQAAITPEKLRRDRIYRASGWVIVGAILAMIVGALFLPERWAALNLTYWMETLALFAFGAAWLTQGRAIPAMLADPRDRQDAMVAHGQA